MIRREWSKITTIIEVHLSLNSQKTYLKKPSPPRCTFHAHSLSIAAETQTHRLRERTSPQHSETQPLWNEWKATRSRRGLYFIKFTILYPCRINPSNPISPPPSASATGRQVCSAVIHSYSSTSYDNDDDDTANKGDKISTPRRKLVWLNGSLCLRWSSGANREQLWISEENTNRYKVCCEGFGVSHAHISTDGTKLLLNPFQGVSKGNFKNRERIRFFETRFQFTIIKINQKS